MSTDKIKNAFIELGKFLRQFSQEQEQDILHNQKFLPKALDLIENHQHSNNWFTPQQIHFNLNQWGKLLQAEQLDKWLSGYSFSDKTPKTIAIVMAGNIPLVGFHDFLCVLLSGNKALVKLSSNDKLLLPLIAEYLIAVEPLLADSIIFCDTKLEHFDAVIATGSNNTARYFEYYFNQKPNIIRQNRNSVAILTGNETSKDLELLSDDIFTYFGLGCRSVSKIFVPKEYDFTLFLEVMNKYQELKNNQKYMNNYDYNKAVFLMSNFVFLDNGFMILKEDLNYNSPISCVFYEYYDDINSILEKIGLDQELLQCVVYKNDDTKYTNFGQTQTPQLSDYADNIDTMNFCLSI
ncbi:MAG: acyl-CoA reductase [Bacteroidota bacterium]|nr:acyl-CoA reductase [Bacteroidota bacterium]